MPVLLSQLKLQNYDHSALAALVVVLSGVCLSAISWTVTLQACPWNFQQAYWSGWPIPTPGDPPT